MLLLVPFLSLNLFSQAYFKKGYIIRNNGDTLQGLVNYKSNLSNSRLCEFKRNGSSLVESFSPDEIQGYRIGENKYYISKIINSDGTGNKVFLEYVLNGIVNLYYLKDAQEEKFFIEKDGQLYTLSNDAKQVFLNGSSYSVRSKQYLGMLIHLFGDNPEFKKKVENTGFQYRSLLNITRDYDLNVCHDNNCILYSKSTKNNVYLEPFASFSYATVGFKNSDDKSSGFFDPGIGANLRIIPFRNEAHLNGLFGISYTYCNYSGDFEIQYLNSSSNYRLDANYSMIRLPVGIEYHIVNGRTEPFISFSYNNNIILSPNFSIKRMVSDYGPDPLLYDVPSPLRRYQSGFMPEIGSRFFLSDSRYLYAKLQMEYRFPAKRVNYILDDHHVTSFTLTFGYGFKINK
jgi:hypothetical protein